MQIRPDTKRRRYRLVARLDRDVYRAVYPIYARALHEHPHRNYGGWPGTIHTVYCGRPPSPPGASITVGYLDADGWRLAGTPYSAAIAALPRYARAIERLKSSLIARVALAAGAPLPPPSRLGL